MAVFRFQTEIIEWRGPSPFFYAPMPEAEAAELHAMRKALTYGWGVIPVEAEIAGVRFKTSLFPKDGTYLVPVKDAVRRAAAITAGDRVALEVTVAAERL